MAIVADKARPGQGLDNSLSSLKRSYPNTLEITKSDSTIYAPVLQALYIGGAGDVEVVDRNGTQSTITSVGGQTVFGEFKQILSTGTDATGLVGFR